MSPVVQGVTVLLHLDSDSQVWSLFDELNHNRSSVGRQVSFSYVTGLGARLKRGTLKNEDPLVALTLQDCIRILKLAYLMR